MALAPEAPLLCAYSLVVVIAAEPSVVPVLDRPVAVPAMPANIPKLDDDESDEKAYPDYFRLAHSVSPSPTCASLPRTASRQTSLRRRHVPAFELDHRLVKPRGCFRPVADLVSNLLCSRDEQRIRV